MELQELERTSVDQLVVNLACLLNLETVEAGTRQLAALTLKAELDKYFVRVTPQTIEHVK